MGAYAGILCPGLSCKLQLEPQDVAAWGSAISGPELTPWHEVWQACQCQVQGEQGRRMRFFWAQEQKMCPSSTMLKNPVKQWEAAGTVETGQVLHARACTQKHTHIHTHSHQHITNFYQNSKENRRVSNRGEISLIFESMQSQWKRVADEAGWQSCSPGEASGVAGALQRELALHGTHRPRDCVSGSQN